MTADTHPESKSRSRRALLAGALGGLGAFAASAIGRSDAVRAGVDGDVVLDTGNTGTATTSITNSSSPVTVLQATSTSGIGFVGNSSSNVGVVGSSTSSTGVYGGSTSGIGAHGSSNSGFGVYGDTSASNKAATIGWAINNSTGVQGYSGGSVPAARAKTGVYGYADQDSGSVGVFGGSAVGYGIYGRSSAGWAGYFDGRVLVNKYAELVEIATPSAPGSNHARLFIRDNGSGKTQLCVRFHSGAVKVLATQP